MSGANAYTYDANGNTTARPGQTLAWNDGNLLDEVRNASSGALIESYAYDSGGQRAIKTAADGTVTHYVSRWYQVEDALGTTPSPTVTYWHGGELIAVDDGSGSEQYLHTDNLGSVVAVTDDAGAIVYQRNYYPFAELRSSTGAPDTDRGYTGQIFDGGIGLAFYNARYMDPALGRFISPDSIVQDPAAAGLLRTTGAGLRHIEDAP